MFYIKRGLFLLIGFFLIVSGCQKVQEDKIPPVIKLLGRNPDTVLLGCEYHELGAIVGDDKEIDEDAYQISGEVNTDTSGLYYLDYTAVDSDGNMAFEQRMIVVEEFSIDFFSGSFSVTDTLLTVVPRQITNYPVIIERPFQTQDFFSIQNFNNFGNNFELIIQPDSTGNFEISYDEQDTIVSGNGWIKCDYSGLSLNYNVEIPGETQIHRATYKK